jgi:arginyl-tRNA--protein-N-Asp/Glu arginylyltransferase
MKRFKSEFAHSYATYSFGYCEYALREHDTLSELYGAGFLPYTGAEVKDTLYMARSARVRLDDFELSSENRRILKKFDGSLTRSVTPLAEFNDDAAFNVFCLEYFKKRHGNVMPKDRLRAILESGFITDVATYTKDGAIIAYVLLAADDACSHFWFSFYDLSYIRQSLGLWLLLDCARAAKREGKRHYYIGTVYGEKGLYKTNFPALEYWDGSAWRADPKTLRALCKTDTKREFGRADVWKEGLDLF